MPYEPPATDQINHDREVTRPPTRYSLAWTLRAPLAKKVLDDPRPKRKRPCLRRQDRSPAGGKPNAGGRGSCEACHRGGYRDAGLQNLLLNLYSLVKERLISQAPPNAGESAVRRTCRRTRSSSTRCFDHRAAGDLNCFREPGLAGRDDRNSADQTWATSFQLSSYGDDTRRFVTCSPRRVRRFRRRHQR